MASPVVSTYSCAPGQTIRAGRWPGGKLAGAAGLSAIDVGGGLSQVLSALQGDVALGGVDTAGVLRRDLGNQRVDLWGQSNAAGRGDQADLSVAPLSADPELAQYMSGALPMDRVYMWTGSAYSQLTAANNGASAGQFGPEFGLGVAWMRRTTSGLLLLGKEGFSGVSIDPTFDPAQGYYTGMRTRHNAATAWLAANGIAVAEKHFVWIQGETDYQQTQSWYQTRLAALLAARLADGLDTAAGGKLLVQMKPGSAMYGAGVANAKTAVAATDPDHINAAVTLNYLQSDNVHCTARGQVQLSYDVAEAIFGFPHVAT